MYVFFLFKKGVSEKEKNHVNTGDKAENEKEPTLKLVKEKNAVKKEEKK